MVRLFLFGTPRIELNGQVVPLRRTKALALLAYLALSGQPREREALLALLWPEFDSASARNNLRRELSMLKTTIGAEVLVADRLTVAWSAHAGSWVDVAVFQEQVAAWKQHHPDQALCAECAERLEQAVRLYSEEFLDGFSLPDSPGFDEWVFFQREGLRQELAELLQALIGWYRTHGDHRTPIAYARRWLALDPLHEPAQRELMRLYTWSGQHSAALRQYEECARLLDAELGAEPEPETRELYEAIKARQLEPPPASMGAGQAHVARSAIDQVVRQPAPAAPIHNLPPTSGFVGRQRELADLLRRLTDPDCRLLTLLGPGGIGKTRLALRAAQILLEEWTGADGLADGVLFVPLAAVESYSGLISALAGAAQLEFRHDSPPHQQVLDHFRSRRMLVILDNFEHLLDTVGFVSELLAAAPGLRLLVTSRVALNLRDEWFHPLDGLAFPSSEEASAPIAHLARFDAVRLFEQHARRVSSDFSLSRSRAAVVRLCQLVEGTPLAIELAAGWLKLFSVEQIVAALEHSLDLLTARNSDTPARHRSMRAVLEESWSLLSDLEQRALAGLAVFPASFSAEAAEAVVGAGLDLLASLVEKALVRSGPDGRFQLHELLRQFAAEKLAADSQAGQLARARHSHYYLGLLAEREDRLRGCAQQTDDRYRARLAAVEEINREAANMRAAWRWAVDQRDLTALDRALYSYFIYFYMRWYIQEGEENYRYAADLAIDPAEPLSVQVRARARIRRGAFLYVLGNYEAAVASIEEGLALGRELAIDGDIACGLISLGAIAGWRGDPAAAQRHLSAGLELGRALGDTYLVADALHELARLNGSYGDYGEGRRLARESLELSRAAGLTDWAAHALLTLAWSSACRGQYAAAEAYYRESLELSRQIGDTFGVATALGGIGWVAWCAGGERLQEARECIEQSLASSRALKQPLPISNYLGDLGLIAIDQGNEEQAWMYAQEGLALARGLDSAIYVAYHLCILGYVSAARQQFAAGRAYLHEALELTWNARVWPKLAFTLYHVALLLAREAVALDHAHPARRELADRALEIYTAVANHPATWHVYATRAMHQIKQLRRDLPPRDADAAIERGQRLDWQQAVADLLIELHHDTPVPGAASAA